MNDKAEEIKADLVEVVAAIEHFIRRTQQESLGMLKYSIENNNTEAIAWDSKAVTRSEDDRRRLKRCSSQLLQLIARHVY